MKNRSWLFLFTAICLVLIFVPGCKTGEDARFTLTVTVGEGVAGSPATGTHTYSENETVSYNYSPQAGYGGLEVQLDGAPAGNPGTVVMNGDHTLSAGAVVDVRGEWAGVLILWGSVRFSIRFNLTGGLNSGTVSGSLETAGNGNGTYTVSDGAIEIVMEFMYVRFTLSGTIDSPSGMSGTFSTNYGDDGTWEVDRQI